MKDRRLLRIPVFALVSLLVLLWVQNAFCIRDYSIDSRERGFKMEKKNTVDAVYIGASHVFSFFEPPLAYEDHGITVFDYAIPSMPLASIAYRVREAYKTQPDALYIINLNGFKTSRVYNQNLHRSLDFMPWSLNKLQMMLKLFKKAGYSGGRVAEYFMPIIRFHSSWSTLRSQDYYHPVNGLKGAYTYGPFLQTVTDVTGQFAFTDSRGDLDSEQQEAIDEILAFLDEKHLKALFVMVPQTLDTAFLEQANTLKDLVTDRGYDCLDLRDRMEEMGLNLAEDFHNDRHLNVHGAVKFTDYLASYLKEQYGFADKRGDGAPADWVRSVALYSDVIGPYTLDFERAHAKRDHALAAPSFTLDASQAGSITVTWDQVPGAEGYAVYSRTAGAENGWWTRAGETEADVLTFTHSNLTGGEIYTYTVVPVRYEGDDVLYGSFALNGADVAVAEAPENEGEDADAGAKTDDMPAAKDGGTDGEGEIEG